MTRAPAVRTVDVTGTDIYGSYDHLVIDDLVRRGVGAPRPVGA